MAAKSTRKLARRPNAADEHMTELPLGWDAGASHTKIGFTLETSRSDPDRATSLITDDSEGPTAEVKSALRRQLRR
jgi:hypothetical protein